MPAGVVTSPIASIFTFTCLSMPENQDLVIKGTVCHLQIITDIRLHFKWKIKLRNNLKTAFCINETKFICKVGVIPWRKTKNGNKVEI